MHKNYFPKLFLFGILVFLFTSFSCVNALTGTISGEQVNLRSGAGTDTSSLGLLNKGTVVTIENGYTVPGRGCSTGWISVSYNNQKGYVCRGYINISGTETYNRPWSSPKKAILGGAEFIASSYIAAGQFTSYLKKFNVNPNSLNPVYDHQYMANIAAPFNEAKTSYKSYKENNLLSLPLEFTIPIFENMPEYTAHPMYGKEVGGTSVVTDKNFESMLDQQGFPETYKRWLRALHNDYPNWTFKSLKTGLDFYDAVEHEKWPSSVNKITCAKCVDSSNTHTEGDWYIPSTETTAYFLDPRNFLMVDSILMFESLNYSDSYKIETVQKVLDGTFMSGTDAVDHLSYASLFMEAGKTYNVNPVYLASLARQESGINGSLATTGQRIEYNGNTYEGFYNLFNIGAYSSESSPIRAGIVYASAGSSKNAQGVFVGNTNNTSSVVNPSNPSNNVTPLATHLSNMKLNQKGTFITNLSVGVTVADLKNKTKGNELAFRNSNGGTLGDTERLGTGSKITFPTGETYEVVLYGDLDGDGKINSADLLKMRQYLLGQINLSGAYLEAARLVNTSGKINSADLLRIRQYLLGQKGISQV